VNWLLDAGYWMLVIGNYWGGKHRNFECRVGKQKKSFFGRFFSSLLCFCAFSFNCKACSRG
jgi:hypothetical protein